MLHSMSEPSFPESAVSDSVRAEVARRLDAIESEDGVRIVFACESGSRAWGFASTDSDYDVRFIYVRPRDWYLSIDMERRRDVIERPVDAVWDINGWDLRKALGLLRKSNPPLLEWLDSPIVYRERGPVAAQLRELAATYYSPRACHFHYLQMAKGNFREYLKGETVWRKKYFYLLRPLLACRYIERGLGQVPMEFDVLVERTLDEPDVREAVARLLVEKRAGSELGRGPADPVLSAFIDAEVARHQAAPAPPKRDSAPAIEPLNALFRAAVDEVAAADPDGGSPAS